MSVMRGAWCVLGVPSHLTPHVPNRPLYGVLRLGDNFVKLVAVTYAEQD